MEKDIVYLIANDLTLFYMAKLHFNKYGGIKGAKNMLETLHDLNVFESDDGIVFTEENIRFAMNNLFNEEY